MSLEGIRHSHCDMSQSYYACPQYRTIPFPSPLDHNTTMDDNSVQTQLRKNSSVRKVHALRRMVLVVSGFCLFAMYFGRSSPSDQHNVVARSLYASSSAAASRSLYTPYDTSTAVTLPTWTDNLADVWDPVLATDTPLYWFIPKAGGTTIVKIFSFCLGLVLASNKGIQTGNTVSSIL